METLKKQSNSIIFSGKVLKVGNPKEYLYGGPKFYMKVLTEKQGTIKVMVSIGNISNPVRELPFVGDDIECSTNYIKDGWANVTLKDKYNIISSGGQEYHNKVICENKIDTIINLLKELKAENYINEDKYTKILEVIREEVVGEDISHSHSHHQDTLPSTPKPSRSIPKSDFDLICPKCNGKGCKFCNNTGGVSL